jgi:hypothetical protein
MMQQGQNRAEPILSIQDAVKYTGKYEILNTAQRRAAEEILTSRDTVQGLQGFAGVGKTTALKTVREAAEQRGYVVEGFAPTSRAAHQQGRVTEIADPQKRVAAIARSYAAHPENTIVISPDNASRRQIWTSRNSRSTGFDCRHEIASRPFWHLSRYIPHSASRQ